MAFSVWETPDLAGILMAAAMGLVAAISHFMIIKAFEYASASELSPFNYFEIVVAIILSYIIFKFIPTKEAVLGLVIIILSGLFVSWRAVKNNQSPAKENDSVVELL
jgi:drug/metabolite transporter (DMT)-like permease